jgi:predicted RNA-binding Zn-ribbon protein involved in translation (DUF1610 family)
MNQPAEVLQVPVLPPAPLEVVIKGKENPVAFACPQCGQLFILGKDESEESKKNKRDKASAHCVKQCICGKSLDYHYWLRCADCRAVLEGEKEKVHFDKAAKLSIEEYTDDPVYWEGHSGDMGDGYFSGVEALLDHCEEGGIDLPEYVWACTRHNFNLDAEQMLQDAFEQQDMDPETFTVSLAAGYQLQAFLDVWVKEQSLHAWFSDCSRAVVLREGSSPPTAA